MFQLRFLVVVGLLISLLQSSVAAQSLNDLSAAERMHLKLRSPKVAVTFSDGNVWIGSGVVSMTRYESRPGGGRWISFIVTSRHIVAQSGLSVVKVEVFRPKFYAFQCTGFIGQPGKVVKISDKEDLAVVAVETEIIPFLPYPVPFLIEQKPSKKRVYLCGSPKNVQGELSIGWRWPGTYKFRIDNSQVYTKIALNTSSYATNGNSGGGCFVFDKDKNVLSLGIIYCSEKNFNHGLGYASWEVFAFARREGLMYAFSFVGDDGLEYHPEAGLVADVK